MRVWTVRPSVAEGHNWIVECDGRVMAMFQKKDEADARFIVGACNTREQQQRMRVWTVGNHGYDILVDGRSIAGFNDYSDSMPDGIEVTDVIQFIVDACNAAEQPQIRQTVTPLPESGFNVHIEGIVTPDALTGHD